MEEQEVKLYIAGYADSDQQERADLAWSLQEQLRDLDVEDIAHPQVEPPTGAKGSALDWAQLVVTLAGSLPPLVAAVHTWLGRHRGTAIALEIDGDRITLSDPTRTEQRELLETWMKRHGR